MNNTVRYLYLALLKDKQVVMNIPFPEESYVIRIKDLDGRGNVILRLE